eukprot:scaffold68498_cov35-Cyclotella_meneghiniana.AAC.3
MAWAQLVMFSFSTNWVTVNKAAAGKKGDKSSAAEGKDAEAKAAKTTMECSLLKKTQKGDTKDADDGKITDNDKVIQ